MLNCKEFGSGQGLIKANILAISLEALSKTMENLSQESW
jgi:hypothetical protein